MDETIEARIINESEDTVYIVSFGSCASVLQKRGDEGWANLFLPDVGCPAVIGYRPFEPGEIESFSITPDHLALLVDEPEGTYRLMWHVAPTEDDAEAEAVASPPFQIVA